MDDYVDGANYFLLTPFPLPLHSLLIDFDEPP